MGTSCPLHLLIAQSQQIIVGVKCTRGPYSFAKVSSRSQIFENARLGPHCLLSGSSQANTWCCHLGLVTSACIQKWNLFTTLAELILLLVATFFFLGTSATQGVFS
ncbi:hypothetical protein BRADI_2g57090v3 [Brachypodium distachyon]|uniref:Uncharacterized protein n=1 Tax=Brachypodium distachyon TaxID=15368 RepID=A0A2K2DGC6_BRADI|nr:hypothetical protein BRADI_2g57090v3 [Brachypodium distachyon]